MAKKIKITESQLKRLLVLKEQYDIKVSKKEVKETEEEVPDEEISEEEDCDECGEKEVSEMEDTEVEDKELSESVKKIRANFQRFL